MKSNDRVVVVITVDVIGGLEFTSPPMESHQADLLLMELSRESTVRPLKAKRKAQ